MIAIPSLDDCKPLQVGDGDAAEDQGEGSDGAACRSGRGAGGRVNIGASCNSSSFGRGTSGSWRAGMLLRVTVNYTVAGLLRFETRCGPVVIDTRGSTRFLRFSS